MRAYSAAGMGCGGSSHADRVTDALVEPAARRDSVTSPDGDASFTATTSNLLQSRLRPRRLGPEPAACDSVECMANDAAAPFEPVSHDGKGVVESPSCTHQPHVCRDMVEGTGQDR